MEAQLVSFLNEPTSFTELQQTLKSPLKFIRYNELKNYRNLEQVLGPNGYVMILYEFKPNFGHWVCLITIRPGFIEFFDPYGLKPDDERDWIEKTGYWERGYLSKILADASSRFTISYNEHDLQGIDTKYATCGKWCLLRIYYRNIPLEQFYRIFEKFDERTRNLICIFFYNQIKNNRL